MNPNDELFDPLERAKAELERLPNPEARQRARSTFLTSASVTTNGAMRHSDHSALLNVPIVRERDETMLFAQKPRLRMLAAILLGVLLAGGLWAVPTLRTFAQDVIDFFIPDQDDSRSAEIFVGGEPPEFTEQPPGNLETVIAQAPYTVYTPTFIPEGYRFETASFEHGTVFITLQCREPWAIMIVQRPFDESIDMVPQEIGASAVIESVDINGVTAQYVHGGWDIIVPDNIEELRQNEETQGVEVESVWNSDLPWGRMVWVANGFSFEVTTAGGILSDDTGSACHPSRDMFAAIARGLTASP